MYISKQENWFHTYSSVETGMKIRKNDLKQIIVETLDEVLLERDDLPNERFGRRDRNRWRRKPVSTSTDPNTTDGRENLVEIINPAYVGIQTRLQIIEKMVVNAMQSSTRQEFKEYLIQIFENLQSLQEKEMLGLVNAYSKVSSLLGLKTTNVVVEQDLSPDTAMGRRNLVKNIYNVVVEMKKMVNEGRKMLTNAASASTVSVFVNEIKALGKQISQLKNHLTNLNASFVKAFQEYESQRGRSSVPPEPNRDLGKTPPPIPTHLRKKVSSA